MDALDQKASTIKDLKKDIDEFLTNNLESNQIKFHKYESRVKEREKIKAKVVRKRYKDLDEFTDLYGVRIIGQFEDDINPIARFIERVFMIDEENSHYFTGDKKITKENDQCKFGYRSLHYVVTLSEVLQGQMLKYPDPKKYKGFKFEIQIRTILQHAWAEQSRNLIYTKEEKMPLQFQRSLARTAAVIETIELDFKSLKENIDRYILELRESLEKAPNDHPIDDSTIFILMTNDDIIQKTEKIIADNVNGGILYKRRDYSGLADFIKYNIKVNTVGDLLLLIKHPETRS